MNELLKRMNKRIHKSDKNIQPIVKRRGFMPPQAAQTPLRKSKSIFFDIKDTKMTDYSGEKL